MISQSTIAAHPVQAWHLSHYAAMCDAPDVPGLIRQFDTIADELAWARQSGDAALIAGVTEHLRLALLELLSANTESSRQNKRKRARVSAWPELWSDPVSRAMVEATMSDGPGGSK